MRTHANENALFDVRPRLVQVGTRLDIRKRVPRGRVKDMRPLLEAAAEGLRSLDNHMDAVILVVVVAGAVIGSLL